LRGALEGLGRYIEATGAVDSFRRNSTAAIYYFQWNIPLE